MAAPLNASIAKGLDLGPGYTLRVTALAVSDGSVVGGVKVNELEVEVGDGGGSIDTGVLEVGPWLLVLGPGA